MSDLLTIPNDVERKLAGLLRDKSEKAIAERSDRNAVAHLLDLAPSGLDALLWQKEWPLEQAMRVAVALGVINEEMISNITEENAE